MRSFSSISLVLTLFAGCTGPTGDAEPLPGVAFGGKADNFYSDVALEFEVRGRLPVESTEEDHVTRRLTAFGLYLTTYLTDKFRGIDIDGDGEIGDDEVFFHNEGYGGFHAMVRNYTVEPVEIVEGEAGYEVEFSIDVAGPRDLLDLLVTAGGTATGAGVEFDLLMPAGATVDPDSVPRGETRRFDPAQHEGELETVRCTLAALPEPSDAYPQYQAFLADGVFDVTLFYGHDYNVDRWDLIEAREAFAHLVAAGYTAPVATFEELAADSGPFVREMTAAGEPVRVEVRVFHSDMFTTARTEQHDLAVAELVARDVFFYNGHAGPYYGFYLDESGAATVGYQELSEVPFDADKQQLFIAQGCQTYSQYADMLYANPAKSEDNLDVIVTVNYSYGRGTLALFDDLVRIDEGGAHVPRRFYEIVGALNAEWVNDWYDVFYGVTGIDGNPQLHPYARPESLGSECAAASECGDVTGNVCVSHEERTVCAVYALGADACPDGSTYGVFDQDGRTFGVCVKPFTEPEPDPEPTPSAPVPGELVITELMPNPQILADRDGEWFEVQNVSDRPLVLTGCQIGDDDGLTITLEGQAVIAPGAYATLARTANPGFSPSYVYGGNYWIANRSDEVILDCGGETIARTAYTGGVRAGASFSVTDEGFCYSSTAYSTLGDREDRGTPGAPNLCD